MKFRKYLILFILLIISVLRLTAQTTDFVTTWKTNNPGVSSSNEISIPTYDGEYYNYNVNWGDGTTTTNVMGGGITHTYATAGTYTVRISGNFPRIYFNGGGDGIKLLSIDQWGSQMNWTSFNSAFSGCQQLVINATDAPNLSGVTDLSYMFDACTKLTQLNSNNWNTSTITHMSYMFQNAGLFNQNINNWNTSNVTDMSYMFSYALVYNQPMNNWNTAKVTNMRFMFAWAIAFDQNIVNWNTSNVTNMEGMFLTARSFNQNIGIWNTSNVIYMNSMFFNAYLFNQNVENWNTGKVTTISNMFYGAKSFNQNIRNWNTSKIVNMYSVFKLAKSFNQNIGNWNISVVADMSNMLDSSGLTVENYDSTLIGWNNQPHKKNVWLGALGLKYCTAAAARDSLKNIDLWNISGDKLICTNIKADFITTWKTDNPGLTNSNQISIPTTGPGYNYTVDWGDGTSNTGVTGGIIHTYASAGTYTIQISGAFPRIYFEPQSGNPKKILSIEQWGTAMNWSSFNRAFYGCTNLVVNATDTPKLSNVTDLSLMFAGCNKLTKLHAKNWNTENITNMSFMFSGASLFNDTIGNWNTAKVISMNSMFEGATSFNLPITDWNTSNVTNMSRMFAYASVFNQPIGNWNTSKVTNMYYMFYSTGSFDQNIGNWNTENVTDMSWMFSSSNSFNQNIGNWNTGKVTDMSYMFYGAKVFNQPIGTWNTNTTTNMSWMFAYTNSFNQNIGNWNISNVTNMHHMFAYAKVFNQPIGNWNTGNVNYMGSMFYNAKAFDQNIGNWDIHSVCNFCDSSNSGMYAMLDLSGLSLQNYDSTLMGWNNQPHLKKIKLGASGLKYCTAATAHALLTGNDNWIITGDTLACPANSNIFVFTGNGNWSNPSNWINTGVPLENIPSGSTILIDPIGSGECIVDIPIYIPSGVSVTVAPNKKLIVMGNLTIQQ